MSRTTFVLSALITGFALGVMLFVDMPRTPVTTLLTVLAHIAYVSVFVVYVWTMNEGNES